MIFVRQCARTTSTISYIISGIGDFASSLVHCPRAEWTNITQAKRPQHEHKSVDVVLVSAPVWQEHPSHGSDGGVAA